MRLWVFLAVSKTAYVSRISASDVADCFRLLLQSTVKLLSNEALGSGERERVSNPGATYFHRQQAHLRLFIDYRYIMRLGDARFGQNPPSGAGVAKSIQYPG